MGLCKWKPSPEKWMFHRQSWRPLIYCAVRKRAAVFTRRFLLCRNCLSLWNCRVYQMSLERRSQPWFCSVWALFWNAILSADLLLPIQENLFARGYRTAALGQGEPDEISERDAKWKIALNIDEENIEWFHKYTFLLGTKLCPGKKYQWSSKSSLSSGLLSRIRMISADCCVLIFNGNGMQPVSGSSMK